MRSKRKRGENLFFTRVIFCFGCQTGFLFFYCFSWPREKENERERERGEREREKERERLFTMVVRQCEQECWKQKKKRKNPGNLLALRSGMHESAKLYLLWIACDLSHITRGTSWTLSFTINFPPGPISPISHYSSSSRLWSGEKPIFDIFPFLPFTYTWLSRLKSPIRRGASKLR